MTTACFVRLEVLTFSQDPTKSMMCDSDLSKSSSQVTTTEQPKLFPIATTFVVLTMTRLLVLAPLALLLVQDSLFDTAQAFRSSSSISLPPHRRRLQLIWQSSSDNNNNNAPIARENDSPPMPPSFLLQNADEDDENDSEDIENSDDIRKEPQSTVQIQKMSSDPSNPVSTSTSLLDSERESDAAVSDATTTDNRHSSSIAAVPEEENDLWKTLLDVSVEGTVALLKGLRWGLAQTLTASLPSSEQQQLLARLQENPSKNTTTTTTIDEAKASSQETNAYTDRGSVAEEVAAANIAESNKAAADLKKLQEELKEAALARVQAELEVQQYQIAQEKFDAELQELKSTKQDLQQQVEALEKELCDAKSTTTSGDDNDDDNDDINAQVAVGERVVAAQQELEAVQQLLEKRKIQQAQLEIVEQDLRERSQRIREAQEQQFAKMREQEKVQQKEPPLQEEEEVPRLSPKEYRALSAEEKASLKAKRDSASNATDPKLGSSANIHPVLGPTLVDLGYKRIHLVSSGKLGNIPIWKKQRTYRNSRARAMAKEKEKSMHLGFPGIICLHEDHKGQLFILDGQHRVGMMQALREQRNRLAADCLNATEIANQTDDEYMFDNVLVEVYPQPMNGTTEDTDSHAEEVFLEINKAEPVKLIDMPGVASSADRKIISEAVDSLKKQFPRMFSSSQRCRVPNVNVDNLRSALFGANVLRRHNLTTSKKLTDWLLVQNAALGVKYENEADLRAFISSKAWDKASRYGFFLGLEGSWLYK